MVAHPGSQSRRIAQGQHAFAENPAVAGQVVATQDRQRHPAFHAPGQRRGQDARRAAGPVGVLVPLFRDGQGHHPDLRVGNCRHQRVGVRQDADQPTVNLQFESVLVPGADGVEAILGCQRIACIRGAQAGADGAPAQVASIQHLLGVRRLVGTMERPQANVHQPGLQPVALVPRHFDGVELGQQGRIEARHGGYKR